MAGVDVGAEDVAADTLDRGDIALVTEGAARAVSRVLFLAQLLAVGELLFDRPL
ncbi:hypothetical protein D3C73_1461210 [compost metagenome]